MAPPFVSQVMPQTNTRLDFSPISNALDGIRDQRNKNAMLDMRREEMEAEQQYRNEMLKIKQAEAARGGLPWWAGQDGSVHPAMMAKLKATPSMGFAPIVIDGALVNRSTGATIRPAAKSPAEKILEGYATGGGSAAPSQVIPQSSQDAPFAGGGVVTPAGLQPVADVMPVNAPQPGAAAPTDPADRFTQQELDIMLTDPKTKAMAQAILDRRAARTEGLTPTKSVRGDLQKTVIGSTEQLEALQGINDSFKSEFLTSTGQAYYKSLEVRAKSGLGFAALSPFEQKQLSEFATFRRQAFEMLNEYIKEQSGTAVSWQEAERLEKALPVAGKGIFDGDDPVSFKAKLNDITQQLTLARARAALALNENRVFDPNNPKYSLEYMKNRLMKEARRFMQEGKKRGLSDADARAYAEERLKMEYKI